MEERQRKKKENRKIEERYNIIFVPVQNIWLFYIKQKVAIWLVLFHTECTRHLILNFIEDIHNRYINGDFQPYMLTYRPSHS